MDRSATNDFALKIFLHGELARIRIFVDMRRASCRMGHSDEADIAKAKAITALVELRRTLQFLPEGERLPIAQNASALELELVG